MREREFVQAMEGREGQLLMEWEEYGSLRKLEGELSEGTQGLFVLGIC